MGWLHIPLLVLIAQSPVPSIAIRLSADPPLSSERLRDTLRSYIDGVSASIDPTVCAQDQAGPRPPVASGVTLCLRRESTQNEAFVLVMVDGDETTESRMQPALRSEDLYRTAALKTQGLLARRQALRQPFPEPLSTPAPHLFPFRFDLGLAILAPLGQDPHGAMRLGAGYQRGPWVATLGLYLDDTHALDARGVAIRYREIPTFLALAWSPWNGRWQPDVGVVAQVVYRRLEASGADIATTTHARFSPRAGLSVGMGMTISPSFSVFSRLSGMAILADSHYRVDGQIVLPASDIVATCDIGLSWKFR